MEFLDAHLPHSDLDCYPEALFRCFAEHALSLRRTAPWCAGLDQEIFDHYVLFPRVNDEDLSFHRAVFFEELWPRIRDLDTMEDRILEVNRWCHEKASYQSQDDRTASPLTVFRSGSGRCGEESAFLVAALRSVGIPARQVYAPKWAHCDDNHAWVEALCGGKWRFLGACEPEPVLDRGWFNTPASRAVLVHSRIFGEGNSPLHGEFLCREGGVYWYNQTARYARTAPVRVQVLLNDRPAQGAEIRLQILNEAAFHTVAVLTADGAGCAWAELGRGDIHVFARLGNAWAEGDWTGEDLILHLRPGDPAVSPWRQFHIRAPKSENVNPAALSAEQKAARKSELRRGTALRQERLDGFACVDLPEDFREKARGNGAVIADFLSRTADPRREALLRTLSDKDFRDVTSEVLEDNLAFAPEQGELPEEIYLKYVLCPRISLERLTPWRKMLKDVLPGLTPAALWEALSRGSDASLRTYAGLFWTPEGAWKSGRWDEKSRGLLFVAILRSRGIPARLRKTDGMPEYWEKGTFRPVEREPMGRLRISSQEGAAYRQNWTLSRWTVDEWHLLNLAGEELEFELPAGIYRLVTTVRGLNGNQHGTFRELSVETGKETLTELVFPAYDLAEQLGSQELPEMPGRTLTGDAVSLPAAEKALLLWLEPGAEPTEHLLLELMDQSGAFQNLPVYFLLPDRAGLGNSTLNQAAEKLSAVCLIPEDWSFDVETVARRLTCDPDTTPLAVVTDGLGRAVCGISGYRVGSGALLARIANCATE